MPPFSYDTCVAANESENGRAAGKLLAAEVLRRGGSCIGFPAYTVSSAGDKRAGGHRIRECPHADGGAYG